MIFCRGHYLEGHFWRELIVRNYRQVDLREGKKGHYGAGGNKLNVLGIGEGQYNVLKRNSTERNSGGVMLIPDKDVIINNLEIEEVL